jgi:HEAT repeat protein
MTQSRLWATVLAWAVATGGAASDSADKFFAKVRRENLETLARSKKAEERARAADSLGSWDDALSVAALTRALDDPDAEVRENAARSLWKLHKVAGSAQPALRGRLEDVPDVVVMAAGALEAMGVDAGELVSARRRALERGNPWVRFVAAEGLIGHAPPLELLPPILDQYLSDADAPFSDSEGRERRDSALSAMKELAKTQDRALVPPLVESLRRMSPGRPGLLRVLAVFEPPPDDWRDALIGLLAVTDTPLQGEAIAQLTKLEDEVDVRAWVPAVARLLNNRGLRRDAMDALASAGPVAYEHAPAIAALLLKGNEKERESAAEALGKIGDRRAPGTQAQKEQVAKVALPALQEAIREDLVDDVCAEAVRALDKLQLDPSVAASALAEGLSRPDGLGAGTILFALKDRGGEAKAALPALEAYLPRAGGRRADAEATLASIRSGRVREPTLAPAAAGRDADAETRAHSYLRAKGVAFEESQFERALHEADLQVVSAFLDAGMSPNHVFAETHGQTALCSLMCWSPCDPKERPTQDKVRESLELLLASGADVNRTDANGITPLMHASSNGCDRVIMRTLLKAGARVGDKDKHGLSAFEHGVWSGHDGLEELIAAGYRMPAARAQEMITAYADNPAAVALVRKASGGRPAAKKTAR